MELTLLYIICFSITLTLIGLYFAFRFWISKYNKKAITWFIRITAIISLSAVFLVWYHQHFEMTSTTLSNHKTIINPDVGCVYLTGVPYGSNKAGNFFAWLSVALFNPLALMIILYAIWPFKAGKIFNKFVGLPVISLLSITLFNYINAMHGSIEFEYRCIFLSIAMGLILALSIILFIEDFKLKEKFSWKDIGYMAIYFVIVFICALPPATMSILFDTSENAKFFGIMQRSLEAYDFSPTHRIILYIGIIIPVCVYFINRGQEDNARKVILIAISLGVLSNFTTEYNAYTMFPLRSDGTIGIKVSNLPIHLCHTALYIVPICIAFNLNRLFYFTYFINVYGAIMAMMWPNVGEATNVFAPSVSLFWYNHIAAFSVPLLCVALDIFKKPKFKSMLWSLLFFGLYFVFILFANAWLSNYVDGYDPNVIGSGTDYLFINGTYILDLLSDQAIKLLDIKLQWTWGNNVFVLYPVYQSIFFVGYVGIAFGMWFVYALFFRIADSHKDLHYQLVIARKQKISLKERNKMKELNNEEIISKEAKFEFVDFSKRYGNSDRLSTDHINLTVNAGEIFGFLGPNGAGKSTCIKTAIGIQPVTEGNIFICGYDVTTQPVQCKKLIGYVPDHYALYEKLTGREYINYIADLYGVSKQDRDERIHKYVDLFELNQAFDNRIQTYSHGMKQKMTVIAALIHNPKVWILDEPLTGLDPQSIYQVKECMKEHAAKGNVVFFSSHIIDVVEKLCTRIAIIKQGHIIFEDSMENVLREHPEGLEEFYMNMIKDNGDLDEEEN